MDNIHTIGDNSNNHHIDSMDIIEQSSAFKIKNIFHTDIEVPPERPGKEYFDEFCKLHVSNFMLTEQMNGLQKENKELLEKYRMLEVSSI